MQWLTQVTSPLRLLGFFFSVGYTKRKCTISEISWEDTKEGVNWHDGGVWLLRCQTEKAIKPNAPIQWGKCLFCIETFRVFPLGHWSPRSPTTAYHCPKTPSQFRALVAVPGLTRSNQTPISSSIMSIEVNWLLPLCLFLSSHEISGIWYLKFIFPTDGILVSGPPKTNQNGILSLTRSNDILDNVCWKSTVSMVVTICPQCTPPQIRTGLVHMPKWNRQNGLQICMKSTNITWNLAQN